MIKINDSAVFSGLGKRANNEDNYGFVKDIAYVVCDGVGGQEKGEVASAMVVEAFLESIAQKPSSDLSEVLSAAESRLSQHIEAFPDTMGMATTISLVLLKPGGLSIAWVGDSRIYQFRNGQIVFQSRDHSWVNEAVDAGLISEEEALNHPKSNVITRAIQGNHKPVRIQEKFIADVRTDDYIFLCSDGVLESWGNDDLVALFGQMASPNEIAETIANECSKHSRDNHTAIILKLERENSDFAKADLQESQPVIVEAISVEDHKNEPNSNVQGGWGLNLKKLLLVLFILTLLIAGWSLTNSNWMKGFFMPEKTENTAPKNHDKKEDVQSNATKQDAEKHENAEKGATPESAVNLDEKK